jgi:NADPH:quinone reductase-like Zn-dependent oxidoreductase
MRAAVITESGGPDVVEVRNVPRPRVGPKDALISVGAAAANYGDIWLRQGRSPAAPPVVPGLDVAGIVESVGEDVNADAVGERVVVYGVLTCGDCEFCAANEPAMCVDYGAIGESRDGGQAEYLAVPAANLVSLPAAVSFRQAAALPSSFGTAHRALRNRVVVDAADELLVVGASGGVGHAAVLLGLDAGADVYACTSNDEKAAKLFDLGVTDVVRYGEEGFADQVHELTDGRGVDVVFDSVGGDVYPAGVASLSRGGSLVTVGATTGDADMAMLQHLFWKQLSVVGSTGYNPADLEAVIDLVAAGRIEPVIDSVVRLDAIPTVHRRLEDRDVFGKVLIEP